MIGFNDSVPDLELSGTDGEDIDTYGLSDYTADAYQSPTFDELHQTVKSLAETPA